MPGEPLQCPPCGAELMLAGWSCHTSAWCVVDLSDLLSGLDVRGEGPLVETFEGRPARDRRFEETEFQLPMVFTGHADRLGDPHPDQFWGLEQNRHAFRTQIVTAKVVTGQLTYPTYPLGPAARVETAPCIASRLEWEIKPNGIAFAVLNLTVTQPWAVVV